MHIRAGFTLVVLLAALFGGCAGGDDTMTAAERRAIADTLETLVRRAYNVSGAGATTLDRLLSLYADTGRVVSASGGRLTASRDSLVDGIRYFWESMGRNMQEPRWIWEQMVTDVLGPRSAVLTATYRVPHRTPRGQPHELAGAMTLVFAKRGDRWVVVQEHISDRPGPQADMSMPGDSL